MSDKDDLADRATYIAISHLCNAAELAEAACHIAGDEDALKPRAMALCIDRAISQVDESGFTAHNVNVLATSCLIWLKQHYIAMGEQRISEMVEEIDEAEALADLTDPVSEQTKRSELN